MMNTNKKHMLNKEDIIDNVANYTPQQLAMYIADGTVTYDELCEEPDFSNAMRREVKELIANAEENAWRRAFTADVSEEYDSYLRTYPEGKHRQEAREAKKRLQMEGESNLAEKAWKALDKYNDNSIREFIKNYPNSSHKDDAHVLLAGISRKRYTLSAIKGLKNDIQGEEDTDKVISTIESYLGNGSVVIDQLYDEICKDKNIFPAVIIEGLEKKGILNFSELEDRCGIGSYFLEYVTNENLDAPVIDVQEKVLQSISPKTTEIYFWGIPSSGKTCALGSIISEVWFGGHVSSAEPNVNCQGYEYGTQLKQIFNGATGVFKLPESTQADEIYEISFTLKNNGMDYPITFIDLAGETIESMYLMNVGRPLSDRKKVGLETACRILKGNGGVNRKIHFFVLEYNGHHKKYKGLTQDTMLTGAMAFIKETGIFKTETDAIYLLVTKSDLAGKNSGEVRNQVIGDYLKSHYGHIYNGLKSVCEENEINDGEVDIIPFSLGEVCFQTLCRLDKETASTVVEVILSRAKGFKTGKLAKLINRFKK